MNVERVAEVIRKAKAILPMISGEHRKVASTMIVVMEENLKIIQEKNLTCPPDLEDKLEAAFTMIELLYNATATN